MILPINKCNKSMDAQKLEQFILEFDGVAWHKQRNKIMNKPTFIGVGAGRCGTSFLYEYFKSHPDIYMSPVKEINYFGIRNLENKEYGLSFREYLYYFLGAKQENCIGEISPVYLTFPDAALVMQKYLPDIKIIITIREPIDRAISQYKHHFDEHQIDDINEYFTLGLETYKKGNLNLYQNDWFHPVKNIMQSLYFEGVSKYIEAFSREQVIVVTFEELKADSNSLLNKLCQFLGVCYVSPNLSKVNYSSKDKIKNLNLNLDPEIRLELIKIYSKDLEQLDSLLNLECKRVNLENYFPYVY